VSDHVTKYEHLSRLVFGVTAASFASMLTVASIEVDDAWLHLALVCFALSIPLSVAAGFIFQYAGGFSKRELETRRVALLARAGVSFGISGIIMMLAHFSFAAAGAFVLSNLLVGGVFASLRQPATRRGDADEATQSAREGLGTPAASARPARNEP